MNASLKHAFLRFIRQHQLIPPHTRLMVAVSGGLDSVVLLHLLLAWRPLLKTGLAVVHINHQLRAAESQADEDFVRELAAHRQLPFYCASHDVAELARRQKQSLEECGRWLRLQSFEDLRREHGYHAVATAHHLDDQVETVLMQLFAGTGLAGIAGIHLRRDHLIRPLLFAAREELQEYAVAEQLSWRQDKSNMDLNFLRNRMRLKIIPYLQQEAGVFNKEAFLRVGVTVQEWLQDTGSELEKACREANFDPAENKFRLGMSSYRGYFSGNRKKLLEYGAEKLLNRPLTLGYNCFRDFSTWLNKPAGRRFWLTGQVYALKKGDYLVLGKRQKPVRLLQEIYPDKRYVFEELGIAILVTQPQHIRPGYSPPQSGELLDAENLTFPLVLRTWIPGDRFIPLGFHSSRKISDFLTDEANLILDKKNMLVLQSRNDIVAVPGARISESYKITPQTTSAVQLYLELL